MFRHVVIILLMLIGFPEQEVTMSWNRDKKLAWDDFQGEVPSETDEAALTASGITFSFALQQSNDRFVSFESTVDAHFYPKKSWYITGRADAHILSHEQLHFDITELHVRRLRHKISKLNVSQNIREELRSLHEVANKELAEMQQLYDSQSDHSINHDQQSFWNKKVENDLKTYEAFASK
ncbi:hypothetical protein [Sediminibacter sp. Hel_I_10]|uniref:DUF922 domain-containing protein n=1 Tax=Sediminibacter sp. Hel_I_10 TaxID=1392490 RepID=UPI00047EC7BE|nr:hypothetical protein [Sediminibacter sp. Hel_I_10]